MAEPGRQCSDIRLDIAEEFRFALRVVGETERSVHVAEAAECGGERRGGAGGEGGKKTFDKRPFHAERGEVGFQTLYALAVARRFEAELRFDAFGGGTEVPATEGKVVGTEGDLSAGIEPDVELFGELCAEQRAQVVGVDKQARQVGRKVERGPHGLAVLPPTVRGFESVEAQAGVGEVGMEKGNAGTVARGRTLQAEVVECQTALFAERETAHAQFYALPADLPQADVGIDVGQAHVGGVEQVGRGGLPGFVVVECHAAQDDAADGQVERLRGLVLVFRGEGIEHKLVVGRCIGRRL